MSDIKKLTRLFRKALFASYIPLEKSDLELMADSLADLHTKDGKEGSLRVRMELGEDVSNFEEDFESMVREAEEIMASETASYRVNCLLYSNFMRDNHEVLDYLAALTLELPADQKVSHDAVMLVCNMLGAVMIISPSSFRHQYDVLQETINYSIEIAAQEHLKQLMGDPHFRRNNEKE